MSMANKVIDESEVKWKMIDDRWFYESWGGAPEDCDEEDGRKGSGEGVIWWWGPESSAGEWGGEDVWADTGVAPPSWMMTLIRGHYEGMINLLRNLSKEEVGRKLESRESLMNTSALPRHHGGIVVYNEEDPRLREMKNILETFTVK